QPPRPQMTQLLRVAKRWLQPDQLSPEAVTERVTMDHFLRALPGELRKAVGLRSPTSIKEMIEATEAAESVLAVLNSGSTITLARPSAIPWVQSCNKTVEVSCVHTCLAASGPSGSGGRSSEGERENLTNPSCPSSAPRSGQRPKPRVTNHGWSGMISTPPPANRGQSGAAQKSHQRHSPAGCQSEGTNAVFLSRFPPNTLSIQPHRLLRSSVGRLPLSRASTPMPAVLRGFFRFFFFFFTALSERQ
uniref:SCAN box domain-containing protein n=1 Tax=Astyanax mexicanus TaxID=7994 RepID=A0A3B1JYH3_ASTMX